MRSRKAFSSPVIQATLWGKPTFPEAPALPPPVGAAASRRGLLLPGDPSSSWVTTADLADQVGDGRESEEDAEAEPVQLRAEELGSVSRL